VPVSLVDILLNEYDEATVKDIFRTALLPPPIFARVNTTFTTSLDLCEKLATEAIKAEAIGDDVIRIYSGNAVSSRLFREGLFHIQDLSSIMCAELAADSVLNSAFRDAAHSANCTSTIVDVRLHPPSALDLCAAPGGKSFTIAQRLGDKGNVTACDIHDGRLKLITDGINRLKLSNVNVRKNDATVYNEGLGQFDVVLCDVPCSGLGVIRRKPEIKYKEVADYREIQSGILKTSSRYVRNGGYLIYSTCTIIKRENEDIVSRFLADNSGFKLYLCDNLPNGFKTILPVENGGDGFFIARLKHND
jgi:16S rRNA (cytosine967-C5)-methyltransferase